MGNDSYIVCSVYDEKFFFVKYDEKFRRNMTEQLSIYIVEK